MEEYVTLEIENGIGTIEFFHPQSNSLPGHLLSLLTKTIIDAGNNDEVKVIILGQDPYHGPDQAHGLSFSVKKNIPFPPSLKNIIKELENDIGVKFQQNDGNLSKWAKQGVFLLNTTLTVEKSKPLSHSKIGWELFTDKVIELLSEKKQNLVFILWGKHAQAKNQLIDNSKHLVISSTHPSPLSAHRGFFGSKPFSQTNNFLLSKNIKEINW